MEMSMDVELSWQLCDFCTQEPLDEGKPRHGCRVGNA